MNKNLKKKFLIIILTFNESIKVICDHLIISDGVFVVDSYSNDKTVEIAKKNGAKIYKNRFINQSKQFHWALKNYQK